MRTHKLLAIAVAAIAATTVLTACGANTNATTTTASSGGITTLTIGASPTPHAVILQYVQDNLAAAHGLNIKIVQYSDYVLPNKALQDGTLNGNYFQHLPYLESQEQQFGYKFYAFPGVHIEPLGVYSKKVTSLADVPNGGLVGVPNDPANEGRALKLLAAQGLITLKDTGSDDATLLDIATNPKNLKFQEIAAEQLTRSLPDLDLAVINGNYAIEAGLNPAKDALALESGTNNPYANMLVVREADKDNPALVELNALLHSDQVKQFILKTWPNGAVIPAF
ncbi:MAG: MetQ/NlpA family ABC transporter substrate-binding protein [Propionibacteriaceae bacterium]|nr:MetQ/NlpA family ABC transporter substrate-binding protein [Propionibacteriaceae bacterium]